MPEVRSLVSQKDSRPVAELLTRITEGFKRAGYHLVIKNEAWLRPGGIRAAEYISTAEGTRYRGALLIQLQRGESRAEIHLTSGTGTPQFEVEWGTGTNAHQKVDKIDRSILKTLREKVDRRVEDEIANTIRLIQ
jgi:hypothetical protein